MDCWAFKHVVLHSNPRTLLLNWFVTFGPNEDLIIVVHFTYSTLPLSRHTKCNSATTHLYIKGEVYFVCNKELIFFRLLLDDEASDRS